MTLARGLRADDQRSLFGDQAPERGLALGTVHRFQGGEKSVVLFSSVVSERRSSRFLDDRPNLLNVTVSRAREHLITIGHPEALRGGRLTKHLIREASPLELGT